MQSIAVYYLIYLVTTQLSLTQDLDLQKQGRTNHPFISD